MYSASTIRKNCEKEQTKLISKNNKTNPELNPELKFLECTSGKLLKYLIRLELKRYEICKTNCSLKIVIKEETIYKLNTEYLLQIIDNIIKNFTIFIDRINNIKNTSPSGDSSDYISGNQLINTLKSINTIETTIKTNEEQLKYVENIVIKLQKKSGNFFACYIIAGIITGLGFGLMFVTMGVIFELFVAGAILFGLCASTDFGNYKFSEFKNIWKSREESGGLLNINAIPKSNYVEEIQVIIQIFNTFKQDISQIQTYYSSSNKDIKKLCVFTDKTKCLTERTKLDTIKKILKNMDSIFSVTHETQEPELLTI
jgi:hypothetical protein